MSLQPLKQVPTSSAWNFRGQRGTLLYWSNRNGRLFAEDKVTGQWYRVVQNAKPTPSR